ncbi:MAG: DUF1853 family protein [Opitutaceae bacterium]
MLQKFLLNSLCNAPLLVDDLPLVGVFERSLFGCPDATVELNFDQKLGHLYEDALALLLDSSGSINLLARNLQVVNQDGRTLGELDYLLEDRLLQRTIHLELAVKFYLAIEVDGEWRFPGPDPRDNWARKLERMCTHQFRLCESPEARSLLKKSFGVDAVVVQQLIYGRLFYPINSESRPLPNAIASTCRRGLWLYQHEWDRYFSDVEFVYLIPKPLWAVELTPCVVSQLELVTVDVLQRAASVRCTLFCLDRSTGPIFLVPDDWLSS